MRCKNHITDGSSRVGLCASCLREGLFLLVEAQTRSAPVLSPHQQTDHRKSDPINNYHSSQPPPSIFPRSVSPYTRRRRGGSDIVDSSRHQNQNSRFYTTPQLGHTNPNANTNTSYTSSSAAHKKKKKRFGIFSNLFRSSNRSVAVIDEQQQEPQIPDPPSTISRSSLSTSSPISSSSTWYSSLIPNRRKTTQESPSTNRHRHGHHHRNKGLSPNYTEQDEVDNIGGAGGEDINSIGSSPGWRKSTTTPAGRQGRGGQNGNSKNVSMTFCLSPLVRASPKRSSHRKDGGGFSGEIRVSVHNPNLSTAAAFCGNRSRKIANFGRYDNNP